MVVEPALCLSLRVGSFEIFAAGGERGNVMRQSVPQLPICWEGDFAPYSIIGDVKWDDTIVTADVLIEVCDCLDKQLHLNHSHAILE